MQHYKNDIILDSYIRLIQLLGANNLKTLIKKVSWLRLKTQDLIMGYLEV